VVYTADSIRNRIGRPIRFEIRTGKNDSQVPTTDVALPSFYLSIFF